ncbi:hypothetical protein BDA99DRAFT_525529 [Phascolomyces articulosus]|uniref:Uncharacterized protein n=1 Tax=Phascolomyces articulosus TaxID=60185 RepID=A0AAD5P8G6_9FUNG|nr:hypothetical protein BDA99DRAFT_525529 [Phascolomyces articulosus]
MLCASSEQMIAPVATNQQESTTTTPSTLSNQHQSNENNHHPLSRNIPLLHDPYDPRIEQEYEHLVQHWTQQLLSKSQRIYQNKSSTAITTTLKSNHYRPKNDTKIPVASSSSTTTTSSSEGPGATSNNNSKDQFTYMNIIDHMNIISLRLMQRTLDTRHMLHLHPYSPSPLQGGQEDQHDYTALFSSWVAPRPGQQQQKDTTYSNSSRNSSMKNCNNLEKECEKLHNDIDQWRPRHSPSLTSLPKVPVVQDAPKGLVANKATTVPNISLPSSNISRAKETEHGEKINQEEEEEDDDDDDEEQELHAPLLRRHQTDSCIILGSGGNNSQSATPMTMTSVATKRATTTPTAATDWTHDKLKKKPSLQTIEQHAVAAMATTTAAAVAAGTSPPGHYPNGQRPLRLVPSPSAPNYSSLTNGCCFNSFAPATNYRRYYPQHHWSGEDDVEEEEEEEGYYDDWKSWFHHQQGHHHQYHDEPVIKQELLQQGQQPLLSTTESPSFCAFCYNPVPKKSLSAGDVEDARLLPGSSCCTSGDSCTEDNQSTSYHSISAAFEKTLLEEDEGVVQLQDDIEEEDEEEEEEGAKPILVSKGHLFSDSGKYLAEEEVQGHEETYRDLVTSYNGGIMGVGGVSSNTMIRSESSISAFRPISKNLAPRCSAVEDVRESIASRSFLYRDSMSCSSLALASSTAHGAGDDYNSSGDEVFVVDQQESQRQGPFKTKMPTITKSRSFPSKVATMALSEESRPALPTMITSSSSCTSRQQGGGGSSTEEKGNSNKERNFVMRSIVSKKVSLSKLFHAKKY